MSITDNAHTNDADTMSRRYPHPFDTPEAGYIVTLKNRHGLHEALGLGTDARWIFRALNADGQALIYAHPNEMTVFDLPIYHCFAARDRSEIVALVSGPDFDVTYNDPGVAAPLFQAVHSAGLIRFAELALEAGFSNIELTNGYRPWEGTIEELIDQCRDLAARNPA